VIDMLRFKNAQTATRCTFRCWNCLATVEARVFYDAEHRLRDWFGGVPSGADQGLCDCCLGACMACEGQPLACRSGRLESAGMLS
jgi:hypothetical protein